jgi:hypothetical protein
MINIVKITKKFNNWNLLQCPKQTKKTKIKYKTPIDKAVNILTAVVKKIKNKMKD